MKTITIKVNLPQDIHRRFKHICVDKEFSMTREASECIKKYVEDKEKTYKRFEKGGSHGS